MGNIVSMPDRKRTLLRTIAALLPLWLLSGTLSQAHTLGPDTRGYTGTDEVTFQWDEVAPELGGSGIELANLTGKDDQVEQIPIGFPFVFYAEPRTSVYVSVNGLVGFATNGMSNAFNNVRIPNANPPSDFVAPFWDDLNLWPTQKVYRAVLGTEPYRRLVIEYFGAAHFDDPNARYFFQVTLYETWNRVRFQYRAMNNGPSFFFGDGRSATIGIECPAGTNGMEWSFNRIRTVSNNMALVFYPRVEADLHLTKTAEPDTQYVGGDIVYTLLISNAGPDRATEVELIDTLPASVAVTGITNSQGGSSYAGNIVTSSVGTVENGSSATVRIYARIEAGGILTNTAHVSAVQIDPNPADNSATQTVTAVANVPLTVTAFPSAHGTSTPYAYGTTNVPFGIVLTNTVNSPADESGGTRFVCDGWEGSGTVPAMGNNPAVFSVTGATTFIWHWISYHYLSLDTEGSGTIGGATEGWKNPTYIYDLVPNAATGYYFSHWRTNGYDAGSSVPLTVRMASGPQDVVAVFTSAFKDVTADISTTWLSWRLDRQTGTYFGRVQICNDAGSGLSLTGPFWYEVPPTADYYLMHPDGTNALDGHPYVDVTDKITPQLSGGALDPGECVNVWGIEFYFRTRVPVDGHLFAMWADPPVPIDYDEAAADTDGDGIANAWEDDWDLDRNDPRDAQNDGDGDGYSALEEYLAGTDPRDAASYLRLVEAHLVNGKIVIRWLGGDRTEPAAAHSLNEPTWQRIPGEADGTPAAELPIPDAPVGYYRIGTR